MTRNRRIGLLAGAVVVVAAALLLTVYPASTLSATITVTQDGHDPVTVFERSVALSTSRHVDSLMETEVALDRWEGELIRVDITSTVSSRFPRRGRARPVGCSTELRTPEGSRLLDLLGWPADASRPWHVNAAGPAARRAVADNGATAFYAPSGHIWHVLRAPREGRLRVEFRPILLEQVGREVDPLAKTKARGQTRPAGGRDSARPPDVFIYLIDALRADHLGCYGYERATSPHMDAFAAQATLFENAHTAATWTRPSVATIMTGLYPSVHGAMHITEALAEWPVLLPEMLHAAGYSTWTITTNGHTTEKWGFKQGYDRMVYGNVESASWVNEQVTDVLGKADGGKPIFMFLHTIEPHAPYAPAPESLARFDRGFHGTCDGSLEALDALGGLNPNLSQEDVDYLIDRYDGDVFDADRGFAGFLEVLQRAGRLEGALVILLSDHGESFLEHKTLQHSCTLSQEEMHVPLIIRFPEGRLAATRPAQPASLIDILPTVLAEVGLAPTVGYPLPGIDLAGLASDAESGRGRPVYAEVSWHEANHLDLVAAIDEDGYKRVLDVSVSPERYATPASLGLWDTGRDAEEGSDLSGDMPVRAAYGEQLIAEWLLEQARCREALAEAPATVEMTDEMRKELQALGYLR